MEGKYWDGCESRVRIEDISIIELSRKVNKKERKSGVYKRRRRKREGRGWSRNAMKFNV